MATGERAKLESSLEQLCPKDKILREANTVDHKSHISTESRDCELAFIKRVLIQRQGDFVPQCRSVPRFSNGSLEEPVLAFPAFRTPERMALISRLTTAFRTDVDTP